MPASHTLGGIGVISDVCRKKRHEHLRKPNDIDGSEDREIKLTIGEHTMSFKGQPYLVHFVMPNFYFHCTTAYDILRHCGVELWKRDFIGTI